MTTGADRPEPAYAGPLARMAGSLADAGILQLVSIFVRVGLIVAFADAVDLDGQIAAYATGQAELPTGDIAAVLGVWALLSVVFNLLYFALQEGSRRSATVGKRLLRLKVVDADTHQRIGPLRAAWRTLAKLLSIMPFGLGLVWMLFDRRRQCLHDKLSRTVVIVDTAAATDSAA